MPPATSRLAIAAFIVGLAGLCPLAGLPAIVLGFVAHVRIRRRPGRLRGRGYALTGIALGSATTLVWLSLWNDFGTRMLDIVTTRMEVVLEETLVAAESNEPSGVEAGLDGPALDRVAVAGFITDVTEAGFRLQRVSVTRFEETEAGFTPRVRATVRALTTSEESWTGEADFLLRPPPYRGMALEEIAAEPRLLRLRLYGPEGRSISYDPSKPDSTSDEAPDAPLTDSP